MSLKIITIGDKTDHGGTVISGSPNHDIRGKAIARLGDKVDCPLPYPGGKPHGVNKIITAHNTLTVDGGACCGRRMHDGVWMQADRQHACDGRLKAKSFCSSIRPQY